MTDRCLHEFRPGECAQCLGHDMNVAPIGNVDTPTKYRPKPPPRFLHAHDIPTAQTRRNYTPINRNANHPALCVNPHCRRPNDDGTPREGRPTEGRANLCTVCEDRARDDLNAVAEAWPDIEEALTNPALSHGQDPVHGTPSPGIVLDETVQAAMTQVEESLAFYGRIVREERGAVFPLGEPSVPELARWLARSHLPWLAAHHDQDVSASLVGDARAAKRVTFRHAYETRPRKISLPFRCRHTTPVDPDVPDGDMRACDALMHTTLHVDADVMPDLLCEHGHAVPPSEWMRGSWRHSPIDQSAVTALVRAITSHTAYTSHTQETQ